jgi:hypothetical protein
MDTLEVILKKDTRTVKCECGYTDERTVDVVYDGYQGTYSWDYAYVCPNCDKANELSFSETHYTKDGIHATPHLYELYKTQKSGEVGWVMEIVPNRTGSFRIRLRISETVTRWTTFVPEREDGNF